MSEVNSLTAGAVTSATMVFFSFMPTPAEILDDEPDLGFRVNEVSAAIVSVGIGFALTIVARNGAPFAMSIIVALIMISGYEYLAHTTDSRLARERMERVHNVRI